VVDRCPLRHRTTVSTEKREPRRRATTNVSAPTSRPAIRIDLWRAMMDQTPCDGAGLTETYARCVFYVLSQRSAKSGRLRDALAATGCCGWLAVKQEVGPADG